MKPNVFKILALAAGVVFSVSLSAQVDEMEGRFEERFAELSERLELQPDQVEPFRAALRETREERKEILAKHGVEAGAGKRENFKALRGASPELKKAKRASEKRMAEILNEEQLREYETLRREFAKEAKKRMKARGDE